MPAILFRASDNSVCLSCGVEENHPAWRTVMDSMLSGEDNLLTLPCVGLGYGDDDMCMFAYSSLNVTSWPIAVVFPKDEMLAELDEYTLQFSAISAAIIIGLLIIISFITSRVTHSLHSLNLASDQIGLGNFDVQLPETSGSDEVSKLVQAFNSMQQALKHYTHELETETANRNRLQGELSAAHQIQMSMLPGHGEVLTKHPCYHLWAKLIPAKSVGGDLYQFNHQRGHKLTFIVGDVSDKGVSAALFMAKTTSLLQQQFNADQQLDMMMYRLNNALTENNQACMFVTLFYAELDLINGTMQYVSAGHHSAQLLREDTVVALNQQGGPAVGLIEDADYPVNQVQLQRGDKLFLYTDGIDEAFNSEREMFGMTRLLGFLQDNHHAAVDQLGNLCIEQVKHFATPEEQSDDITVMTLSFMPAFTFVIPLRCANIQLYSLRPELQELQSCFANIDRFAKAHHLSDAVIGNMKLVSEEILCNAIEYGCEKTEQDLYFVIGIAESGLLMEFIDPGFVYNPLTEAPEPVSNNDDIKIGGLGVHFVKAVSQQLQYEHKYGHNHLCVLLALEETIATES